MVHKHTISPDGFDGGFYADVPAAKKKEKKKEKKKKKKIISYSLFFRLFSELTYFLLLFLGRLLSLSVKSELLFSIITGSLSHSAGGE